MPAALSNLPSTMAATPPPSAGASEPKPSVSEAIQAGADLFFALVEAEKAKATAASRRTIRDLEARFSEFQKSSHSSAVIYTRRCADLEAAIRSTRTAHAQVVAERSLAHTRMSEAQWELAKVKHELDHLKTCSKTEHSSCLQFTPEQAGDGAVTPKDVQNHDAEVQADDLNMLFSLGELRRQLMATQQLLEEKERDCKAVETERDDLKAAMGTEVMMLNNRICLLQAELELLKGSPSHSQTGNKDNDTVLAEEATFAVAYPPSSSVPRDEPQNDDTLPSKTSSPSPLSPSAVGQVPPVTSSVVSTHTTSHLLPSQTSPSMHPTPDSPATNIQKDDETSSSKRPASGSIGSSLETSTKRVKRVHLPHNQSPVLNGPYHQPSGCGASGLNIGPAAPQHSSNQSGSEPKMKHTSATPVSARYQATSEGNADHRSPRVSDNQNQAPPSRPKPKPAYSGRPSDSTIADGTDADVSKKNAPVSEHTPSRPKPRPAYSGANSIHSASASSHACGSAD